MRTFVPERARPEAFISLPLASESGATRTRPFVARARKLRSDLRTPPARAIVVYAEKSRKAVALHVWRDRRPGHRRRHPSTVDRAPGGRRRAPARAADAGVERRGIGVPYAGVGAASGRPHPVPPRGSRGGEPRPRSAPEATPEPARERAKRPRGPRKPASTSRRGADGSARRQPDDRSRLVESVDIQGGTRHLLVRRDRRTANADRLRSVTTSSSLPLFGASNGEVYPFLHQHTHIPVIEGLGATREEYRAAAFALSSKDSAGNKVGTSWQSFDPGAWRELRIRPRRIVPPSGVELGYRRQRLLVRRRPPPPRSTLSRAPSTASYGGGPRRTLHFTAPSSAQPRSQLSRRACSTGRTSGGSLPRTSVGRRLPPSCWRSSDRITSHIELSLDVGIHAISSTTCSPCPAIRYVAGGALESDGHRVPRRRVPVLKSRVSHHASRHSRASAPSPSSPPAPVPREPGRPRALHLAGVGPGSCPDVPQDVLAPGLRWTRETATHGRQIGTRQGSICNRRTFASRLVGVFEHRGPGLLIDPSNPQASVIYAKLTALAPRFGGPQWPFSETAALRRDDTACVLAWGDRHGGRREAGDASAETDREPAAMTPPRSEEKRPAGGDDGIRPTMGPPGDDGHDRFVDEAGSRMPGSPHDAGHTKGRVDAGLRPARRGRIHRATEPGVAPHARVQRRRLST